MLQGSAKASVEAFCDLLRALSINAAYLGFVAFCNPYFLMLSVWAATNNNNTGARTPTRQRVVVQTM